MAEVNFVHLHTAVLLGNIYATQPEFARLPHQFASDGEVLAFELVNVGDNFLVGEFFGVCAISKCGSVKSSGVNTSSGVRSSIRKLPPDILGLGTAVSVAITHLDQILLNDD
jgi:hypothetical protein